MSSTPVAQYSLSRLAPLYPPARETCIGVQLAANTTYAQGTVLAEVSTTPSTYQPYSAATLANPVTPPTLTPAGSDGTLPVGEYSVAYSYVNGQGQTLVSEWANVAVAATNHIAVTAITPLPAGVTSVNWFLRGPGTAVLLTANNNGAAFNITALPAATAAAPPTANTAYTSATGAQNPTGFLVYACTTDPNGVITAFGEFGMTLPVVPMLVPTGGVSFRTQDLPGLDQNALSALHGLLVEGTLANGTVFFG